MRKQRKGLAKSSEKRVLTFGSTATPLNARRPKDKGRTGPTSTPKTSRDYQIFNITMKVMKDWRMERAELLWRYKALKVINQKLLSFLTEQDYVIYGNLMDKYSISKFDSEGKGIEEDLWTFETGQTPTSSSTSGSTSDPRRHLRKDKKFMAVAEQVYNEFQQAYSDFLALGDEPEPEFGSHAQPDPDSMPYK